MELTPKQDLKLQFGGEYSLEFLTEHEAAESDAVGTGAEVVSINGPQRLRKTRAFVIFGGRPTQTRARRQAPGASPTRRVKSREKCDWSESPQSSAICRNGATLVSSIVCAR
jgi:hypothetical protein